MEILRQLGCSIFVDLFCGSIAMLCYLLWDTVVVVNDINDRLNFDEPMTDSERAVAYYLVSCGSYRGSVYKLFQSK